MTLAHQSTKVVICTLCSPCSPVFIVCRVFVVLSSAHLAMAESAYLPFAIRGSDISDAPRHSAVVRITHWITTVSFFGLLVSGIAILLSHPRLYWGETGNVGTPSLIDLPLPFVLENQNGWGRYLHFLSAWVAVLNGLLYALSGLLTPHFRK